MLYDLIVNGAGRYGKGFDNCVTTNVDFDIIIKIVVLFPS